MMEGPCDEYWVLYVIDEPLNSILDTNIPLYANNWNLNKNLEKGKKNSQRPKITHYFEGMLHLSKILFSSSQCEVSCGRPCKFLE